MTLLLIITEPEKVIWINNEPCGVRRTICGVTVVLCCEEQQLLFRKFRELCFAHRKVSLFQDKTKFHVAVFGLGKFYGKRIRRNVFPAFLRVNRKTVRSDLV